MRKYMINIRYCFIVIIISSVLCHAKTEPVVYQRITCFHWMKETPLEKAVEFSGIDILSFMLLKNYNSHASIYKYISHSKGKHILFIRRKMDVSCDWYTCINIFNSEQFNFDHPFFFEIREGKYCSQCTS